MSSNDVLTRLNRCRTIACTKVIPDQEHFCRQHRMENGAPQLAPYECRTRWNGMRNG
jgi:hypothetical protein